MNKNHSRYNVSEFGVSNQVPGAQIMSVDKSDLEPFTSSIDFKPLDPHKKCDRIKLNSLRMKLDALKNMADRTGSNSPYTLYKELPGRCVNLFTINDVFIKPRSFVVVKLKPGHKNQLADKVWMAHPYKNMQNHIDYQNQNQNQEYFIKEPVLPFKINDNGIIIT